ncbi:MAG: hypothetical protein F9K36_12260 [Burkholderiaceae bacterium]|nr:MAG: hypothetical protein F9K36_12260 [Burkholderiaceae bacterium]
MGSLRDAYDYEAGRSGVPGSNPHQHRGYQDYLADRDRDAVWMRKAWDHRLLGNDLQVGRQSTPASFKKTVKSWTAGLAALGCVAALLLLPNPSVISVALWTAAGGGGGALVGVVMHGLLVVARGVLEIVGQALSFAIYAGLALGALYLFSRL